MKKNIKDGEAEISIWSNDEINNEHEGEVLIIVSESESDQAQSAYANIEELISVLEEIRDAKKTVTFEDELKSLMKKHKVKIYESENYGEDGYENSNFYFVDSLRNGKVYLDVSELPRE